MKPSFIKIFTIFCAFSVVYIGCLVAADDQSCPFQNCNCTYNETIGYVVICDNLQAQTSGDFPSRNTASTIHNVTRLSFSNYRFKEIPIGLFENLSIGELEFSNNGLETIDEDVFRGIWSLSTLRIHEPKLQDISSGALSPIFLLSSLDLSRSELTNSRFNKLNKEMKNLTRLLWFDISENNLTYIDKVLLAGRNYVIKLDFSYNQISKIDADAFNSLVIASELDLSNNRLQNFSTIIEAVSTIRQLDLSNNLIENLDGRFQRDFTELKLANNRIEKVANNSFSGFNKLLLLELHSNQIDTIEPNAFDSLPMLSYLNLADNKIAKLPSFSNMPRLNYLDLTDQNSNLRKLDDYSFERKNETNLLRIGMPLNDIEQYGNKAFCTRGYNYAKITRLHLSYVSMKNMHKCILKQLRSTGIKPEIYIDQPDSPDVSEVCTCDLYAFAKNILLDIKGACDSIFSGPTCANATFVDPCTGLDQYQCPSSSPTTTPITTRSTPRQTTTSSARKSGQSTATVFYTFCLTTLLFIFSAF